MRLSDGRHIVGDFTLANSTELYRDILKAAFGHIDESATDIVVGTPSLIQSEMLFKHAVISEVILLHVDTEEGLNVVGTDVVAA